MNLTIYAEFLIAKGLKGHVIHIYQFIFPLRSTYNVPLMPFCIKSIDHLNFTVPLRLFLQFSFSKLFFWTVEEAFI